MRAVNFTCSSSIIFFPSYKLFRVAMAPVPMHMTSLYIHNYNYAAASHGGESVCKAHWSSVHFLHKQ